MSDFKNQCLECKWVNGQHSPLCPHNPQSIFKKRERCPECHWNEGKHAIKCSQHPTNIRKEG